MPYPPYRTTHDDFDDDDNFQRCRQCGAEYLDDPDEADHATDCPSNPYGFNHPEGVKLWMKADLETEESDRPIDLPIPVYTGSEF
jgi:hypothetical protein